MRRFSFSEWLKEPLSAAFFLVLVALGAYFVGCQRPELYVTIANGWPIYFETKDEISGAAKRVGIIASTPNEDCFSFQLDIAKFVIGEPLCRMEMESIGWAKYYFGPFINRASVDSALDNKRDRPAIFYNAFYPEAATPSGSLAKIFQRYHALVVSGTSINDFYSAFEDGHICPKLPPRGLAGQFQRIAGSVGGELSSPVAAPEEEALKRGDDRQYAGEPSEHLRIVRDSLGRDVLDAFLLGVLSAGGVWAAMALFIRRKR
jgi:hypothetical protein